VPETAEQIAQRFGMPTQWARYHEGQHICVDGRNYIGSCLVTDPATQQTAQYFINKPTTRTT